MTTVAELEQRVAALAAEVDRLRSAQNRGQFVEGLVVENDLSARTLTVDRIVVAAPNGVTTITGLGVQVQGRGRCGHLSAAVGIDDDRSGAHARLFVGSGRGFVNAVASNDPEPQWSPHLEVIIETGRGALAAARLGGRFLGFDDGSNNDDGTPYVDLHGGWEGALWLGDQYSDTPVVVNGDQLDTVARGHLARSDGWDRVDPTDDGRPGV